MAQGRLVAPPGVDEGRFGVKQTPVHEAPPLTRPVFQQSVAVGIEQQYRHLPGQLRQRAGWCAVDADGQLPQAAFDADRSPPTVAAVQHRHHPKPGRIGLNQLSRLAGAKRTAATQNVQRLQQTGLAGGVGTDQQVQARRTVDPNRSQVTKPGNVEGGDPHGGPSAPPPERRSPSSDPDAPHQSRIGMMTCLPPLPSASSIRQLLAESEKDSLASSPPSAPSASSRYVTLKPTSSGPPL